VVHEAGFARHELEALRGPEALLVVRQQLRGRRTRAGERTV
jgi:hypothetical protein